MIGIGKSVPVQAIEYISLHPYQTAYQISFGITERPDSVSSVLVDLVKRGQLSRRRSANARRGWEYFIPSAAAAASTKVVQVRRDPSSDGWVYIQSRDISIDLVGRIGDLRRWFGLYENIFYAEVERVGPDELRFLCKVRSKAWEKS